MIIALVGMCGSGKSEASDYLRKQGVEGVYFGELTMEKICEAGQIINPENERKIREEIRREHGMGGYATLAMPKINKILEKGNSFYIDGLYSTEEYEILDKKFPEKVFLIEIYTDKDIRYRRLGKRPHRPLTPEQCRARDWAEVKNLNKGGPIALSDYKINNNGEMQELHRNLDKVLKKIEINNK